MRRFWLVLALSIGALAAVVWTLRISEVKVEGAVTLSTRAVVDASGLEPGQRILWERLSVAERRIERIPAVRDVVAERELPSTVVLRVIERTPIARLDGARHLVVDEAGVVFPLGEATVEPVLYGWRATRVKAGARVDANARKILESFPTFPDFITTRARKIRAGTTFTLTLLSGTEVRFGLLRDLRAKAVVAEAVIRREADRKLAYVDVRSPTVPVSRERAPQTPVPAPGSSPAPQGTPVPGGTAPPP